MEAVVQTGRSYRRAESPNSGREPRVWEDVLQRRGRISKLTKTSGRVDDALYQRSCTDGPQAREKMLAITGRYSTQNRTTTRSHDTPAGTTRLDRLTVPGRGGCGAPGTLAHLGWGRDVNKPPCKAV